MPQRSPLKSLKAACLHNIATNMDKIWCKDYQDNLMGQGQFIYINGPFDYLPGSLVHDLIQTLKKEQLLHRHHLHVLITSKLERLDLAKESGDLAPILNLIPFQCKDILKELILANCPRIPKVALKNTISTLSNLEVLDLSWTSVHDDVLSTVGSTCTKLRELNVSLSHYVSDKGVKSLFVDEVSKNGENRFGKCKALSRLHIQDTRVTAAGVEAALQHLPNLQHLSHPELVSVLDYMHRVDWEAGVPIPPYRLRSLFADYRLGNTSLTKDSPNISFSVATDVCPHTTEVHLLAYRYKECPDALLSLCKLKHLSVLNITIDDPREDDCLGRMDLFSYAVIPVLQACGHSVTTLSLGEFPPGVDVGIIGICCPALQNLNLAFNKGYANNAGRLSVASSSLGTFFTSLKKLTLVCICSHVIVFRDLRQPNDEGDAADCPSVDVSALQMKALLSSPLLESVFIRESSVLSDSLLKEVLSNGQRFQNLKALELEQCHNITAQFVYALINLPGPLNSIKIWECKQVSRADYNSFKSISKRNKWDLLIDWM